MSYRNLPNALCVLRIVGSIVLIGVALAGQRYGFVGLYLILGATDLVDGPLARWLGEESETGAGLDSLADVLLSVSLVAGIAILSWELFTGELALVGLAVGSYMFASLFGYWKFKRLPSFHNWAAKANHLLVAIAGVVLILQWSVWPLRIAALATVLTNIESFVISCRLKQWQTDVPSIFLLKRE